MHFYLQLPCTNLGPSHCMSPQGAERLLLHTSALHKNLLCHLSSTSTGHFWSHGERHQAEASQAVAHLLVLVFIFQLLISILVCIFLGFLILLCLHKLCQILVCLSVQPLIQRLQNMW